MYPKVFSKSEVSARCGDVPFLQRILDGLDEVHQADGGGIDEAVADARLRAQMDDALELFACEEFGDVFAVGEVEPEEAVVGVLVTSHVAVPLAGLVGRDAALIQASVLEADVVVVVDVVDADDLVSAFEKAETRSSPMNPAAPVTRIFIGRIAATLLWTVCRCSGSRRSGRTRS